MTLLDVLRHQSTNIEKDTTQNYSFTEPNLTPSDCRTITCISDVYSNIPSIIFNLK